MPAKGLGHIAVVRGQIGLLHHHTGGRAHLRVVREQRCRTEVPPDSEDRVRLERGLP